MPFSNDPVYVGKNDLVQVRYPTPTTWNTQIPVAVRIGTGNDPDGIIFGTRIPDSKPEPFNFDDQQGTTNSGALTPGDFTNKIEKNTTYYSNPITITGIELAIPATVTATVNGPKGTTVRSDSDVAFRITRSGVDGPWISTTTDLRNNDIVRLRIKTQNWYTTTTNITFTASDETWGTLLNPPQPSATISDTWSITTRAQDQNIDQYSFTDYVDLPKASDPGGSSYKTQEIPITGIDNDVVLRASATGDGQVSSDNISWSQLATGLKLNDTLYTRIAVGANNTQKTTSNFNVFATGGDTLAGGYENNTAGTYGTGNFSVSQSLGSVLDNWQVWTEVDRYPNAFSCSPLYVQSDKIAVISGGIGYQVGIEYAITGGSGSGMTVKVTAVTSVNTQIVSVEIVEKGSGYQIGNILRISGNATAELRLDEYENVVVSSTSTNNFCEPGFTYYTYFTVGGLGTEYATGAYSDFESPANVSNAVAYDTSSVNGSTVQISCNVVQGAAQIRKNNTGSWVQQLFVSNNDIVNVKFVASSVFNTTLTSVIEMLGPPNSGPSGNPTSGPSVKTYVNKKDTITLKTRLVRTNPYPFKIDNIYNADLGVQYTKQIPISGLDAPTSAQFILTGAGTAAQLSLDDSTYGSSISISPSTTSIFLRATSPPASDSVSEITYSIGTIQDTFYIFTKKATIEYSEYNGGFGSTNFIEYRLPRHGTDFDFVLVGAGGGNGGDDIPNSYGGRGGIGNAIKGKISLPVSVFPIDPSTGLPDRRIKLFVGDSGKNGVPFTTGGVGGLGGFGYAVGGNGGSAGASDKSGSGGGGGGASAITLYDGTLIALAGGGAGGAGAGNDTTVQSPQQNGNYTGFGTVSTSLGGLSLTGNSGYNNTNQGGGGGGGGGGYGLGGTQVTEKRDASGVLIQTIDLDGLGGSGGGAYTNPLYVTLDQNILNNGSGPEKVGAILIGIAPQDVTPDAFSFIELEGADINTLVESDRVLISGFSGSLNASASGAYVTQVRVCSSSTSADPSGSSCTAYTSLTQEITSEQYIQVKTTTGDDYFTPYVATVSVGTVNSFFIVSTGESPDKVPDTFTIANVTGQLRNTDIISSVLTVSGINVQVPITASNGASISINGGPYVDNITTIRNGNSFRIKLRSSTNYNAQVSTDVRIGDGNLVTWNVRTATQQDSRPDSFTFNSLYDQPLNQTIYSSEVVIQGIGTIIPFSVTVTDGLPIATIIKNDVDLATSTTTVENFDIIKLKYTTSNELGQERLFSVSAGVNEPPFTIYNTIWNVVNTGTVGTRPNAFLFPGVIATGPGVDTFSDIVTISGLSTAVSVFATNGAVVKINGASPTLATFSNPASISNGQTLQIRLRSFEIPGFSIETTVYVGAYNTPFLVQTPAPPGSPVKGQWYSSIQPIKALLDLSQIRYSSKFDGLPVGTMMPVFQDSNESDKWGNLTGKMDSRFHGWIECNGAYVSPTDYPILFSVLGNTYGATGGGTFRLPDMRNRKVFGTGPVIGQSSSSPIVSPGYGSTKLSGGGTAFKPGSFGGMWFIDKIASPGIDELEQVETPGAGLPAVDSDYFAVAQIQTSGYEKISGPIEFITTGKVSAPISLKANPGVRIFEAPNHVHQLITGQADPGNPKGRVPWDGYGGYNTNLTMPTILGVSTLEKSPDVVAPINIWGYATENYFPTSTSDTVRTNITSQNNLGGWFLNETRWGTGYPDPNLEGYNPDPFRTQITVTQNNISNNLGELNTYINLNDAISGAGGTTKCFVASIDIPRRFVSVTQYSPQSRKDHTHYISLTTPPTGSFSYGNSDGHGTAYTVTNGVQTPSTTSVNLEFNASELGLEVLPGTFVMNNSKQLIPSPSLAPQKKVPLITPYIWVKWLIKAF